MEFTKENFRSRIWWSENPDTGEIRFSFDREKSYSVWDDYPYNMTPDEVKLFDAENPQWASFFKCRRGIKEEI